MSLPLPAQDIGDLYSSLFDLLADYRPGDAGPTGWLRQVFYTTAMDVYGLARMQTGLVARGGSAEEVFTGLSLLRLSAI